MRKNRGSTLMMGLRTFAHGYEFDPTYGMNLEQLLAIDPPEPPADFAAFWARRYAAALTLSPRPYLQSSGRMLGGHVENQVACQYGDEFTYSGVRHETSDEYHGECGVDESDGCLRPAALI